MFDIFIESLSRQTVFHKGKYRTLLFCEIRFLSDGKALVIFLSAANEYYQKPIV